MSNVVAQSNLFPPPAEFTVLKEIASMAVKSGLLPSSIKTAEQACIIALKGRELGIPPMVAFAQISVINGKPCMSAELMLSQIYKTNPAAVINFLKNDNKECVIEASRKHSRTSTWSFTLEDAQNAGLLGKQVWKQYPAAMLRARAISAMARAVFPDALNGVSYTPEELGAEVEIDDDGTERIKDVTPKAKETEETKPLQPTENTEAKQQSPPETNDVGGPTPIVNHALPTEADVDSYKTNFAMDKWKVGRTFADLGVSGTKDLQTLVMSYCLKIDAKGGKIPPQLTKFIELSKMYLTSFE